MKVKYTTQVRGTIRIMDAPEDVVDRFTDRLMEALLANPEVQDPGLSGSLAKGEVFVHYTLSGDSVVELDSMGPRHLHDAVMTAGIRPIAPWTDIPEIANDGELEDVTDEAVHELVEAQGMQMVKSVLVGRDLVDA